MSNGWLQLGMFEPEPEPEEGLPTTEAEVLDRLYGKVPIPLAVAYGLGVDSTAVLIELGRKYRVTKDPGFRPEVIMFADTGGEKPETYAYLPVMQAYLAGVGFPPVTVVRYVPQRSQYTTLEENCLVNGTLPSLAYGRKSCSLKWKKAPQDRYMKRHCEAAVRCWAAGLKVIKILGYDAGVADGKRAWRLGEEPDYRYWYPLRQWGWTREWCVKEIVAEGLPGWNPDNEGPGQPLYWVEKGGVPIKSACYFCPANKTWEIDRLIRTQPALAERIVALETRAAPGNTTVEGLWRSTTRNRPGSMTEWIRPRLDEKGEKP